MEPKESQKEKTVKHLKLTFAGGASTVTGANFIMENIPSENGDEPVRMLIDCGFEQGGAEADRNNEKDFTYDVTNIDYLFVTHAHIDHIGRIPKLVKDGFKGKIFSSVETHELAPIMLADCVKIITMNSERENKKPMYGEEDVAKALTLWHEIPYFTCTELKGNLKVCVKDAGHILGSVMYEFDYNGKKIVFTGDLGNTPTPLLRDTEDITDATYMVMESVYGDRNHESIEERRRKLECVIEDAYQRGGALIIPCFSLEKTQVLLYEMNELMEAGRIPKVPVYLDSPLAIKVTDIYKRRSKAFNKETLEDIKNGDDIFNFPGLVMTQSAEESKNLLRLPNPKIIIAGSGMSTGGRITHHEINHLPDPKSTILLIGYQSVGTLGRRIQDGEKKVRIYGQEIAVHAKVETIDGYSSHKDSEHLLKFVEGSVDTLKKVFVVMGEPKASMFLAQRIQDYLAISAYTPKQDESVTLDF